VFALFALSARRATASLAFSPTFDSTITSDPNAAAIEGAINNVLANYSAMFGDPITVHITFASMSGGLGQSNFSLSTVSYQDFYTALLADGKSADDAAALARLGSDGSGSTNPVTGTTSIFMKPATIRAVGLNCSSCPSSDGTISINTHITDIGSPGTSGQYSFIATVEHEVDEILGLGSTLGVVAGSNQPSPEDFFRFTSAGARSFTTSSSATAYFSINGTTDLAQFDNQNDGGDFGDWQSNPRPAGTSPQVQDAFATPGAHPALGVELGALDVIGYDLVSVPEPASYGFLGLAIGAVAWFARRRSHRQI
jgi:hypothetical protein